MRYLERGDLARLVDWLAGLKDRKVPQMMVTGLALLAGLTALLMLIVDERFTAAPHLQFVINAVPPLGWGLWMLGWGGFCAGVAWVNYQRAWLPALVLALSFYAFGALNIFDFLEGPATGIISLLALAIGWFGTCTTLLCVAPRTAQRIHEQEAE